MRPGALLNLHQLTTADRGAFEALALQGTAAAAMALTTLLGQQVAVGSSRCEIAGLAETVREIDLLPNHVTVVYLQSLGDIAGQLMLVLPSATATSLVRALVPEFDDMPRDEREKMRRDALGEIGNIVLTSYLNELVRLTGLEAEPTAPMVATDTPAAVLELPIARAAGDNDVVVQFDTTLAIGNVPSPLRAPFHVLFLPAPGGLSALLEAVDTQGVSTEPTRIPVRMGEFAVSRRAGDVLVANALGSCVAVVLVDPLTRVAAMAHVMLPQAPECAPGAGITAYAARYADSAVPALLLALERAGGRRVCTVAYIAGGGQMFTGSLAESMDVPLRNVEAVRQALKQWSLRIRADETGGTTARTLEIDVASLEVSIRVAGGALRNMDAA